MIGGLNKSYSVAVNSNGYMIVTERATNSVSVLNPEGEKTLSFGTHGSGDGQFKFPCGVTVDQDDNIYVTEVTNNRIQKFTSNAVFIAMVGKNGFRESQFIKPAGICYNKTNHLLYVCDQGNSRIQVLTIDLTFVRSFGSKGAKIGTV